MPMPEKGNLSDERSKLLPSCNSVETRVLKYRRPLAIPKEKDPFVNTVYLYNLKYGNQWLN
jgi:hypothetical protein